MLLFAGANVYRLIQRRLKAHLLPRLGQCTPVACFRSACQVSLAKSLHTVISDALRLLRVCEEIVHSGGEIGEVALDFDVILLGTGCEEQVVVVLDPLQLM